MVGRTTPPPPMDYGSGRSPMDERVRLFQPYSKHKFTVKQKYIISKNILYVHEVVTYVVTYYIKWFKTFRTYSTKKLINAITCFCFC